MKLVECLELNTKEIIVEICLTSIIKLFIWFGMVFVGTLKTRVESIYILWH